MSVTLPILCAMGTQAVPLPLSVLSAHTGGFGDVARADLTQFAAEALAHFEQLSAQFDALYAGYVAHDDQLDLVARAADAMPGAFVMIDPAMADHGRYYRGIGPSRAARYRAVFPSADLITPNLTEARLLLDAGDDVPAAELAQGLLECGCGAVLITGADLGGGAHANLYRARDCDPVVLPYDAAPGRYPGTGDMFAAVLLGALLRGEPMDAAVMRAAGFVREAVLHTGACGGDVREGARFEGLLGRLFDLFTRG